MLCTQSIYSQNTSNFWSKSGNVVSQNDFIGSSNPGSLVFKTNDTERFRIIEQGDIVFSNNKLMNISHLFADSLDIGHTKRMTIDSLFVLKKFKFGTSSIQFDDDRNCIYASEDEKLFLQSFDFGTLYDEQHTILNLYSGNVGIGTEFPQMKLHIKKVVSPLTLQANLIPKRDGADTTRMYDVPEELDESIMTEERTGSMRLEVEVIEGSSSVWDIHPCASINPEAGRHRLLFTNALENQTVMTLESGGYAGIGTLSPLQKLHIHNGNILITAQSGKSSSILFNNGYGGSSNWGNYGIEYIEPDIIGNNKGGLNFWRPWGNAADGLTENFVLHLANDGNVGIGTGSPEYKLEVNKGCLGIIPDTSISWTERNWRVVVESPAGTAWRMKQPDMNGRYMAMGQTTSGWYWILSDGNAANSKARYPMMLNVESDGQPKLVVQKFTWSDHVFDEAYTLSSLEERKEFVSINKHLPGIDNEQTIFTEGLDIPGVMEGMTKNIEEHELYLYMLYEMILELKKENEELRLLIEQSKQ